MKIVCRLTPQQIKAIDEFKNTTLNNKKGHEHVLEFSNAKLASSLLKAFEKGKGKRVNGKDIKSIMPIHDHKEHEHEHYKEHEYEHQKGKGLNIGKAFKSLGHDITHVASQAGNTIKQGVYDWNNAMKNNPIGNKIVYGAVPELAQQATKYGVQGALTAVGAPTLGNVLGNVSGNAVKTASQAGLKSQGYGSGLKRTKKMKHEQEGKGLMPLVKGKLTSVVENMPKESMAERMARIRSFRKKPVGHGLVGYGKGLVGYGD